MTTILIILALCSPCLIPLKHLAHAVRWLTPHQAPGSTTTIADLLSPHTTPSTWTPPAAPPYAPPFRDIPLLYPPYHHAPDPFPYLSKNQLN